MKTDSRTTGRLALLAAILLTGVPVAAVPLPPAPAPAMTLSTAPLPVFSLRDPGQGFAGQAGRTTDVSGFVLPVDQDEDRVYRFLLVPWAGACSHMPAPPADQVILVTPETPFTLAEIYQPVTVTGMVRERHEISQIFILDGVARVESGFVMSVARIRLHDRTIPGVPPAPPTASPWKFLKPDTR
ncbi:DUF3299 domain-containing protein [Zhengella sp. ZM62]|uniref:DUF3299 domain-containing protein n=1 Tax=Zhengella sedimenti TaxID=3390035 RepID=UPI0039758198